MRRIIYQSVAVQEMDRPELFRLVYHARVANERNALGGFLLFSQGRFLQVLEGEAWKLCATFDRIRQDVRHRDVVVIDERSIDAPIFGKWRMRCFDGTGAATALNAIAAETGGAIPGPVERAVVAFFGFEAAGTPISRMHPV